VILHFKKALKLVNARRKEIGEKKLTQQKLGEILLPDKSYKAINYFWFYTNSGQRDTFEINLINFACEVLEVDANFLFGQPSVYDEEFCKFFPPEAPEA
jgi:hypothetical protein